jgi:hypothetical protein
MDFKLVKQLHEDLFTPVTKKETEERKASLAKNIRARAEIAADELVIIKELHEDNLAPNKRIKFTAQEWVNILVAAEEENPGILDLLQERESELLHVLMILDEATSIVRSTAKGSK